MKYVIDVKKRPVYLQLYGQIRDDILNGVYAYNSKLPSKRSLAEETGVSTVTVEHAYALLCDEGYAEGRPRSGYVVIFRKSDGFAAAARSEHTPHPAPSSAHAHPDFPLSVSLDLPPLSCIIYRCVCRHPRQKSPAPAEDQLHSVKIQSDLIS